MRGPVSTDVATTKDELTTAEAEELIDLDEEAADEWWADYVRRRKADDGQFSGLETRE